MNKDMSIYNNLSQLILSSFESRNSKSVGRSISYGCWV